MVYRSGASISSQSFIEIAQLKDVLEELGIASDEYSNEKFLFSISEDRNGMSVHKVFNDLKRRKVVLFEVNYERGSVSFPAPGNIIHTINTVTNVGLFKANEVVDIKSAVGALNQVRSKYITNKFGVPAERMGRYLTLETIAETPAFGISPEIISQVKDYALLDLDLNRLTACMMLGLTASEVDDYKTVPKTYIDAILRA
jgi:hypothetical protein